MLLDENFGSIDRIVPNPQLRKSRAQVIDIDRLLGVQNKSVTRTTIRKSFISPEEPIKIESTTVTHPSSMSVPKNYGLRRSMPLASRSYIHPVRPRHRSPKGKIVSQTIIYPPVPVAPPKVRRTLPIVTQAQPLPMKIQVPKQEVRPQTIKIEKPKVISHTIIYPPVPAKPAPAPLRESLPIITPADPLPEKKEPPKQEAKIESVTITYPPVPAVPAMPQTYTFPEAKEETQEEAQLVSHSIIYPPVPVAPPTTSIRESLPIITPADPLPEESKPEISFLPAQYLPTKIIKEDEDISQYLSQIGVKNEEITNSYETGYTEMNAQSTGVETQNVDSLLRPSIRILEPKVTKVVLPPLSAEDKTY